MCQFVLPSITLLSLISRSFSSDRQKVQIWWRGNGWGIGKNRGRGKQTESIMWEKNLFSIKWKNPKLEKHFSVSLVPAVVTLWVWLPASSQGLWGSHFLLLSALPLSAFSITLQVQPSTLTLQPSNFQNTRSMVCSNHVQLRKLFKPELDLASQPNRLCLFEMLVNNWKL